MFLQKGSQSAFIPAGKAAQTLRPWCEPLIICTTLIYIHIYFKDVLGRSDVASQQVKPLSATASHIGVQQHPRLGCHLQPACSTSSPSPRCCAWESHRKWLE